MHHPQDAACVAHRLRNGRPSRAGVALIEGDYGQIYLGSQFVVPQGNSIEFLRAFLCNLMFGQQL